jgi:hypothetical protein
LNMTLKTRDSCACTHSCVHKGCDNYTQSVVWVRHHKPFILGGLQLGSYCLGRDAMLSGRVLPLKWPNSGGLVFISLLFNARPQRSLWPFCILLTGTLTEQLLIRDKRRILFLFIHKIITYVRTHNICTCSK